MTKSEMVSRAPLVEAIKHRAAEENELARQRDALTNAQGLLSAAETKLDATKAECQAAREEHTSRVMAAASTSSDLKPSSRLRDARLREAEAQDECDAAREAVTRMQEAVAYPPRYDGAPNDPATIAGRELAAKVDDTIRSEVDLTGLLDECDDLYTQLSDKREAVVFLISQDLVPPAKIADWGNRMRPRNLPSVSVQTSYGDGQSRCTGATHTDVPSPSTDAWKAARAALLRDPATPLPTTRNRNVTVLKRAG